MPQGSPGNMMVKRGVPSSVNYYMMFHSHTTMMCGAMKEQMTCMLKALENCPASVVNQVEMEFEKAMNMSMPDTYGVVSFKDTKRFVQNTCPKLPKGFAEDTCSMGVYNSQNFTMCNENATMKYSKKKSCEVHALSKQCIAENVQPECGEEMAMFLTQNTHMIFPGIPDNCEETDVSGSDVKQTSFGLLLMSTIFTLLYM
ncbi:uncharacterized protein LOC123554853 [Mercenaria mercenaria]|uniref:uncharacterized protein LOC123554853 n=1 Tax=Mercenaria mercenaria TaxID=6596 RepID=UPI00234F5BC3|nr:uncharacterized protein LOC123554853 [Mercenaria mercenaria]